MGEQAQQIDAFVATLQSCMDSRGWNLTMDESSGILEPFSSDDEMYRARADSDSCLREQNIDPHQFDSPPTEAQLRTMYRYDVDTYECLAAQGLRMEQQPPSADAYVESALAAANGTDDGGGSWWPYFDPAVKSLGRERIAELEIVCPTRWTFATLS